MRCPSPAINKRRHATYQWILFMTESLNITPKTTRQNLIVDIGKSEADVTNNNRLRSTYNTVEANYWQIRSIARPLSDSKVSCSLKCGNLTIFRMAAVCHLEFHRYKNGFFEKPMYDFLLVVKQDHSSKVLSFWENCVFVYAFWRQTN